MLFARNDRGYLAGVVVVALAQSACGASSPLFDGNASGGDGAGGDGAAVNATGAVSGTGGTGGTAVGGSGGSEATGGRSTGGTGGLTGTGGSLPSGGTGGVRPPVGGSGGQVTTQPYCPQVSFRGAPPHVLEGTTAGLADTYTPGCGASRGSGDTSFVWLVPYSGRFKFDTAGSSFDTVLAVQNGVCSGEELACNDDIQGSASSEVSLDLLEGQNVTITVDGYGGAEGSVTVHVTEVRRCPDADLGSTVPATLVGDTADFIDRYASSCGAYDGSPDFVATFTAPFSGQYVFDTQGSDFDTVLGVRDGLCGATELDCNDDGDMDTTSLVSMQLAAGEQVTLVVDGWGGNRGSFRLSVDAVASGACCDAHAESAGCTPVDVAQCVCNKLPNCCTEGWDGSCADAVEQLGCGSCGRCPDSVLDGSLPSSVSGSTLGLRDRWTSDCGSIAGSGDYVVEFTAPYRSTFVFDTRGSDFDTILSLKNGGCLEPVRICSDDDGYGNRSSLLVAVMSEGETVALVVDGFDGDEGDFVLNVSDQNVAGDCCLETPLVAGCTNSDIAKCICEYHAECCESAWTSDCVMHVYDDGCGTCTPGVDYWD